MHNKEHTDAIPTILGFTSFWWTFWKDLPSFNLLHFLWTELWNSPLKLFLFKEPEVHVSNFYYFICETGSCRSQWRCRHDRCTRPSGKTMNSIKLNMFSFLSCSALILKLLSRFWLTYCLNLFGWKYSKNMQQIHTQQQEKIYI